MWRFSLSNGAGWGADGKKRSKKANGRILNGKHYDEMPPIPVVAL